MWHVLSYSLLILLSSSPALDTLCSLFFTALLAVTCRYFFNYTFQFSSVTQSCPSLCDSMDCSTLGFPVHHQLPELAQIYVHRVVIPSNHLILCHLLLLPPSIFPSIRVFSSDSFLRIRWPKYWSFSINPSNEYSELISFRIDWFDLFAVQGTV